jgi:hypothetical protein
MWRRIQQQQGDVLVSVVASQQDIDQDWIAFVCELQND